jgi:hypothetical protein
MSFVPGDLIVFEPEFPELCNTTCVHSADDSINDVLISCDVSALVLECEVSKWTSMTRPEIPLLSLIVWVYGVGFGRIEVVGNDYMLFASAVDCQKVFVRKMNK